MRVLVVWGCNEPQSLLRKAVLDYIYSFQRYDKNNRYYYLNMPFYSSSWDYSWIEEGMFDVVLFTCTFLGVRWNKDYWRGMWDVCERVFAPLSCRKVILPQDDYDNTGKLWDFIQRVRVNEVYSVIPSQDYCIVYPQEKIGGSVVKGVLTGYVEESYLGRTYPSKTIDVMYRANKLPYKFGKLGQQKTEIIDYFVPKLNDFSIDICNTVSGKNVYTGDEWLNHLAMARCTLGTPSGSSIMDVDGDVGRKYANYLRSHPNATYDEAKGACFPDLKENLHGTISPRHFEAAITHTCQILLESDYAGILKADRHYIPIDEDYGNIDEVIEKIRDDTYCRKIAQNCYHDIVESGDYSFRTFVSTVMGESNKKNNFEKNDYRIQTKCDSHNRRTEVYNALIQVYHKFRSALA